MFKKFGIGMLAVVLAIAFSAFTSSKPSTPAGNGFTINYWYTVDLATNRIPQNAQPLANPNDPALDCPSGTTRDCQRGFVVQPNTAAGDVTDPGDAQKTTDN